MAPKVAEKAVKAPATKAPAAKKVVKKATKGASKKKVKAVESYKIYIYKVLKQVRPTSEVPVPVLDYAFFVLNPENAAQKVHGVRRAVPGLAVRNACFISVGFCNLAAVQTCQYSLPCCRYTQTQELAPRLCPFWIPSLMISLRRLQQRQHNLLGTTRSLLSHPARYRLQSGSFFLESLPSMQYQKALKLSPSSHQAKQPNSLPDTWWF